MASHSTNTSLRTNQSKPEQRRLHRPAHVRRDDALDPGRERAMSTKSTRGRKRETLSRCMARSGELSQAVTVQTEHTWE